jgi:hypothetical protein
VQAFPTLWIFGQPQVDPIVTQGFLERPKLEALAGWKIRYLAIYGNPHMKIMVDNGV